MIGITRIRNIFKFKHQFSKINDLELKAGGFWGMADKYGLDLTFFQASVILVPDTTYSTDA
jgi:hypothetical protein